MCWRVCARLPLARLRGSAPRRRCRKLFDGTNRGIPKSGAPEPSSTQLPAWGRVRRRTMVPFWSYTARRRRAVFSVGCAARDEGLAGGRAHAPGRMARGRRLHGVVFHGEQGAVAGRQDQRSCLRRARWLSPPPLSQALFSSVGRSAGRSSGRTRAAPPRRWSRTRPASAATVCTSGCRRSAPTQRGECTRRGCQ